MIDILLLIGFTTVGVYLGYLIFSGGPAEHIPPTDTHPPKTVGEQGHTRD